MSVSSKFIGEKVGRLTVEDIFINEEGKKYFKCKCDCGNIKFINYDGIRKGRTKSCGCLKKEVDAQKAKSMGSANTRHGMSRTRIYKIWDKMKSRCINPNDKDYPKYGGRGITFDPRWNDFVYFYRDMKEGYSDNLTIERIDVDGNYCKSNCTWIPHNEQSKNRRTSIKYKKKKKLNKLKELNGGKV
jgi:hypothetical protein